MSTVKITETDRQMYFGGDQCNFEHWSKELGCTMKFSVFFPPNYSTASVKFPVLYFLSGLTCTHENFPIKSGMQKVAAKKGIVVVSPDTSPRGSDHPKEHEDFDFGSSAGFYLDATNAPWKSNYRMYSYVTKELLEVVSENFNVSRENRALSGHSMGGHGSLVIALKNPAMFRCITALAPISNPCISPWGIKAFSNYLGQEKEGWSDWDATELVEKFQLPQGTAPLNIMVCQGEKDRFLKEELLTQNFIDAAKGNPALNVDYRFRKGYDHMYPYIATFIEEHFDYVADFIC